MDVIHWLDKNAGGFNALSSQERAAPMHFSLIWSYFESVALNANGSADAIAAWLRALAAKGKLDTHAFCPALVYLKDRYFQAGQFTHHFHRLNLRKNDSPVLVASVLSGDNLDPVDSVVALFIILYRFRNNYFHGEKWADHLQDQLENFTLGSEAIMAVLDMSFA